MEPVRSSSDLQVGTLGGTISKEASGLEGLDRVYIRKIVGLYRSLSFGVQVS